MPRYHTGSFMWKLTTPDTPVTDPFTFRLMPGSIGRTDLPGGDHTTLINSIRTVLLAFGDSVPVHPGHYASTTIGQERRTNPFLQAQD